MKTLRVLAMVMFALSLVACGQGTKFVQHTVDVDTAFNNYEWFRTSYEDIQAMSPKIRNAYDMWQQQEKGDLKDRKAIEYTGLTNILHQMIADYNAKSKMWNRTLFKDKNLPWRINVEITGGDVNISESKGKQSTTSYQCYPSSTA